MNDDKKLRIEVVSTGGTIEKAFDESDGSLKNDRSHLPEILSALRLHGVDIGHRTIMSKDSLEMNDEDRRDILMAVQAALSTNDAVIIIHGTDTLSVTGDFLHAELGEVSKPVVLTGAMRPFEFRDTDAFQNVTEALLACRFLDAGVFVVMHNRALRFPGPRKDRTRGTFI